MELSGTNIIVGRGGNGKLSSASHNSKINLIEDVPKEPGHTSHKGYSKPASKISNLLSSYGNVERVNEIELRSKHRYFDFPLFFREFTVINWTTCCSNK